MTTWLSLDSSTSFLLVKYLISSSSSSWAFLSSLSWAGQGRAGQGWVVWVDGRLAGTAANQPANQTTWWSKFETFALLDLSWCWVGHPIRRYVREDRLKKTHFTNLEILITRRLHLLYRKHRCLLFAQGNALSPLHLCITREMWDKMRNGTRDEIHYLCWTYHSRLLRDSFSNSSFTKR